MTTQRNIAIVCLIVFLISGCGGTAMSRLAHVGDSASLKIIINDNEIKDEEDSSMFVDALKEILANSFKDISIQRGYNSAKVGELVIIPQSLSSSAYMKKNNWDVIANVVSIIKVLTFTDYKVYTLSVEDVYEPSLGEVLVLAVPFVGHMAEAALKGPYGTAAKNKAMQSMAAEFYNRLVSSPEFKTYVDSVKMAKTLPANLEMTLRFTDADSFMIA